MLVRIRIEAQVDLENAADFYNSRDPGIGDAFLAHMEAQFAELSKTAGIHPMMYNCYRKLVTKFPYAIYYLIIENRAEIIAVCHQRRDTGNLRKRLRY